MKIRIWYMGVHQDGAASRVELMSVTIEPPKFDPVCRRPITTDSEAFRLYRAFGFRTEQNQWIPPSAFLMLEMLPA